MDYEKAYKEALERAVEFHKDTDRHLKATIERIFPELRESEDERIRKTLVRYFEDKLTKSYEWIEGLPNRSVLDWLEKQKENPKSADSIPSDCVSDVKCEDRSPKHTDSFGTDIRDTPAYWRGWDDAMKQKEQEHPDGCFTCDEYKKGYEAGRFHGFTAGYNKAMKEQKPVCGDDFKWTSQDERCRSKLIDVLELADAAYPTTKDSRDELWEWLKELPMKFPNKDAFIAGTLDNDDELSRTEEILGVDGNPTCYKQKPTEWSEEDEDMLNSCISSIEEAKENRYAYKETDGDTSYDREINWLKSLRPVSKESLQSHWKPSEEQMEALEYVIRDYREDSCNATANYLQEILDLLKNM